MSEKEAARIAQAFVMKHSRNFKTGPHKATKKEIQQAVNRVARALQELHPAVKLN